MPIARLETSEYVLISDIKVGKRVRTHDQEFRQSVEATAESLQLLGPIQPLLLDDDDQLVDGETRLEAYKLLGETEVPVCRRSNIDAGELLMLEMEANLRRKRIKWVDNCIGILRVHETKSQLAAAKKERWELRATGSLVKASASYVQDALVIAKLLLAGDAEIASQPSMNKAMEVVLARKEAAATKQLGMLSAGGISIPQTPATKATPIISITLGPPGSAPQPTITQVTKPQLAAFNKVTLSDRLHNVDSIHHMKHTMKAESVDLIVTDIPYGIDPDLMEDMQGIDMMRSTHQVDQNVDQMQGFLEGCHRVLRENSYLFFFYALQHHEKLRNWGLDAGFKVQDWPLLWLKPHNCKNNAPHCNFTKSFEPVMVMRKGKPTLRSPMNKCHLEVDGMGDKRLQSNPFAKPLDFLREMIFKPVSFPGQQFLDPMAGEGSIVRAAILSGCQIKACEIDKDRFPALVDRVKTVYKNMMNSNVEFD